MYRRLFPSVICSCLAVCLASTAWAQTPPDPLGSNPPVRQDIGFLDTNKLSMVSEADCRVCHSSGVPDRHHTLYGQPIPTGSKIPFPGGTTYSCTSCHGTNFTVVRDCTICHTTSPHHTSAQAVARDCKYCHGSLVNNFNDGHAIPTYAASLVTPSTSLTDAGWHDEAHTKPWLLSDGSGTVTDADVLLLESGAVLAYGVPVTRTDPNELHFTPAGFNNDFMIDEANRGSNPYSVVFQQGAALGAAWNATTKTLTVTVAPTQTAAQLVAAINAAVAGLTGTTPRVRGTLLHDGEDPVADRLAATEYSPLGGLPHNNRGFGAGGCNYCHDDDGALDINGDPAPAVIVNNHDNHHSIGLPTLVSNGAGGTWAKCNICHDYTDRPSDPASYHDVGGPAFDLHIRICEECHGLASLHNIQADSNGGGVVVGGELAGYGHVGRDAGPGDSDCWGCHGFATSAASAPFSGPVIPTVYNANRASIPAGTATALVLSGAAFSNTTGGTLYESDVRLTAADGSSVTLQPDTILDQGNLAVTIPGNTPPGNYKLQAAKGDVASNPAVISVTPAVRISRAVYKGTVTILGTGFAGYADGSPTAVTATISSGKGKTKTVEAVILSWSDTKIVADFGTLPRDVTVHSVFGSAKSSVSRR